MTDLCTFSSNYKCVFHQSGEARGRALMSRQFFVYDKI